MVAGVFIDEAVANTVALSTAAAVVGIVGPASKGPLNRRLTFATKKIMSATLGTAKDRHHAVAAAVRYLTQGNQLNFVRVAGTLAKAATLTLKGSGNNILKFTAGKSGTPDLGSWYSDNIRIAITYNGTLSYNVDIYLADVLLTGQGAANVTNASVAGALANSQYVICEVLSGAGTTFPDETIDALTEQIVPVALIGGNDGVFASTESPDSSSGGFGARIDFDAATIKADVGTAPGKDLTINVGHPIRPALKEFAPTANLSIDWTSGGVVTLTDSDGDGYMGTFCVKIAGAYATTWAYVDYENGIIYMHFANADVPTANTAVLASYAEGNGETVGAAVAKSGATSYSGTVSRPGVLPNTFRMTFPLAETVSTDGNGATNFTDSDPLGVLAARIVPGSLQFEAEDALGNTMVITDAAGDGNLTGDVGAGTNTANYTTGAFDLDFSSPVPIGNAVRVSYRSIVVDNGSGVLSGIAGRLTSGTINYITSAWALSFTYPSLSDAYVGQAINAEYGFVTINSTVGDTVEKTFTGFLNEFPVKPGSVRFAASTVYADTDDGNGNLSGTGVVGTVDYFTGEYSLTYAVAPGSGVLVIGRASAIVGHIDCQHPGDIGNERSTLTDGFYISLDADPDDATLMRLRVMFNPGSGAVAQETFGSLADFAGLLAAVNDPHTGSKLITVRSTGLFGIPDISTAQNIGLDGAYTVADVIGTQVGATRTGMRLFNNPNEVRCDFITAPGIHHRQVQLDGLSLFGNVKLRTQWVCSVPDFTPPDKYNNTSLTLPGVFSADPVADIIDWSNGNYKALVAGGVAQPSVLVPFPPKAALNSPYGSISGFWVQYADADRGYDVWEGPEGEMLALAAFVAKRARKWFSMAGFQRGALQDISDLRYSPDDDDLVLLTTVVGTTQNVINPFINFQGQGLYLFGQRTTRRDAAPDDRINVRWLLNDMENSFVRNGRVFVFEQADPVLWREITAMLKSIIRPIAAERGIDVGGYSVICNESNNTPDVREQNRCVADITIKPTPTAEQINFLVTAVGATGSVTVSQ